jgi:chaperonin GroES
MATGKDVQAVKAGDQIIFKGYSQTDIKVDGTDYILVKEEDIIATVK